MSLPTDSVAPAPPTGTSNPWSLVQWWKRICDWIAALSPSGADKYDTGWVTSGVAVTGNANFTVSAYSLRRIGNHIKGRITVTFTGNPLSSDASGDFANVALPTIPAAWAPTGFSAPITMERVGAAVSFGWAETTGQLRLVSSSLQSAVVLATGATYVIYLDHFTN